MSATNATSNYELPIFLATDKPAWLTDWNGAMTAIDTAIHAAQAAADGAQTTASAATVDIATINASLSTITGNITSLTTAVNGNTAAINTINSLIGNGEPTTTDKTLIGAINEIYAMITGGGSTEILAANVSYDNTSSGLTASSVQAAIDEVYAAIPGSSGYDFDLSAHTGDATVTGTNIVAGSKIRYAINSEKTIGKIYGGVWSAGLNISSGNNVVANIAITDFPTVASEYTMDIGFATIYTNAGAYDAFVPVKLVVKTDETIDVVVVDTGARTNVMVVINFAPCVLFFDNFGD